MAESAAPGARDEARERATTALALRERLAALHGGGPAAARPARPARPAFAVAGGREEATPFGPCYLIERRYRLDHHHGPRPLGALRDVPPPLLAQLGGDPRLAELPHDRLLLLDTETTGLAGGTGTYVFLVGLGYFAREPGGDGWAFVVRQYFLRELREERALLHALAGHLAGFGALVTFNGKSFDWPLLATRFTLARQAVPGGGRDGRGWPHLDLLHPARRVWRHRLANCRLGSLEAGVLGVRREADVPSFLIPALYFQFLRDGDHEPLLPVLAHNEADVVSLLALLAHLGHLAGPAAGERRADGPTGPLPGADCYGLATLHAALGRADESIAAYGAALADPALALALRRAARAALALALKRARRPDEAAPHWRQLIRAEARRKAPDPWAWEELAKYQEHVARDYAAATATVAAALALLELRGVTAGRAELLHRLARLRRKSRGRDDA